MWFIKNHSVSAMEQDPSFKMKQIRRLLALPVLLFVFTFLGAITIFLTHERFNFSEKQRSEIERLLRSQNNLLVNELFLNQEFALKTRMELIQEQIRDQFPESRICVSLKKIDSETIFNSCNTSDRAEKLLEVPFSIGDLKLGVFRANKLSVFNGLPLVWKFTVFGFLIAAALSALFIIYLSRKIETEIIFPLLENIRNTSRSIAKGQVAEQVAHDIRSPLSALDMVLKDLEDLPEEKRLMVRSATQRIKDIANNLIEQHKKERIDGFLKPVPSPTIQLVSSILDSIISEKRTQFRAQSRVEIELQLSELSYGLFAIFDSTEMKRLMSNLINNSVEALGERGIIKITLESFESSKVRIQIIDNGKGIPENILTKLGQRGVSVGKEELDSGSGLGLYHARTAIESWNGLFRIDSVLGKGTTVSIILPKSESPPWFVEKIEIVETATVAVLDDDISIHQVWSGRFQSSAAKVQLIHFSTSDDFYRWFFHNTADLYLVDYELLGRNDTGLDVIEKKALYEKAILVTSHFEEPIIQSRCENLKLGLIPKVLASLIPIQIKPPVVNCDAILIDDDPLIHTIWKIRAKDLGKNISCYFTFDEFWFQISQFDRRVPIYIDSCLGGGVKGEIVSQLIKKEGFLEINLATGYQAKDIGYYAWISKIVGKEPPW